MNASLHLRLTVAPVLGWMTDLGIKSDERAAVLLLAIAGQESGYRHRVQMGGGPACSLYQCEKGGGAVTGVLRHRVTGSVARLVCEALLVPPEPAVVHKAIEHNDALACALSRLLLYSDPAPLPPVGYPEHCWHFYLRVWRPGKPHPESWAGRYSDALMAVKEAAKA